MPSYQQSGQCVATPKQAATVWVTEYKPSVSTIGTNCVGVANPAVSGTEALPTVTMTWTRLSGTCAVPPPTSVAYTAVQCVQPDLQSTFALLRFDTATVAEVYAWGFASVLMFWGLGYAISAAKKTIRYV